MARYQVIAALGGDVSKPSYPMGFVDALAFEAHLLHMFPDTGLGVQVVAVGKVPLLTDQRQNRH